MSWKGQSERKHSPSNKTDKKDDVAGRLPWHSSSVMQQQQQQLVPSPEQQQEKKSTSSRMSPASSSPAVKAAATLRGWAHRPPAPCPVRRRPYTRDDVHADRSDLRTSSRAIRLSAAPASDCRHRVSKYQRRPGDRWRIVYCTKKTILFRIIYSIEMNHVCN